MLKKILYIAILSNLVFACSSPRGLSHKTSSPTIILENYESGDRLAFAKEFFNAADNVSSVYQNTPFGSNIEVQSMYTYKSALNHKCKKGVIKSNLNQISFVVCRDDKDNYKIVDDILKI